MLSVTDMLYGSFGLNTVQGSLIEVSRPHVWYVCVMPVCSCRNVAACGWNSSAYAVVGGQLAQCK